MSTATDTHADTLSCLYLDGVEPTDHLISLVEGEFVPTAEEVAALWAVYVEGEGYMGDLPTLVRFSEWFAAGAEIIW